MGQPRRTRLLSNSLRRRSSYQDGNGDGDDGNYGRRQQRPISSRSERLFVLQVSPNIDGL
jgi:hypothetical protein